MDTNYIALVVSGDRHLRKLLTVSLDRIGCDALDVATGQDGLRCVDVLPLDIVIVDLANDPSAAMLLQRLRTSASRVKVVCLMGDAADERRRLSGARVDAYLRKPFRLHELNDVVECWRRADMRSVVFARAAMN